MAITYRKLWIYLRSRGIKKKELSQMADVSPYILSKLSKGENVTADVILRICTALDCTVDDIMEITL